MFEVMEHILETLTNKPKYQKYIHRDELGKKKQICKPKRLQRSPQIIGYYREENESTEMFAEVKLPVLPCVVSEDVERRSYDSSANNKNKVNNIRVKVVLTKKEAIELLAKLREEGNLESKDVINELVKLPNQRLDVVSISSLCQNMELSTIPEEDEDEDEDEDYL